MAKNKKSKSSHSCKDSISKTVTNECKGALDSYNNNMNENSLEKSDF